MNDQLLPGFDPTAEEQVHQTNLAGRIERAVKLLRDNVPPEGYYLAFSGGKDSCVIKKLAGIAGVKYDAHYSQTTIDPPELVRFIKQHHPDVQWEIPSVNMMKMLESYSGGPPTRFRRWCCQLYKENGGAGRVLIMGVRAAESRRRAKAWQEITTDIKESLVICPIVYWLDDHVWEFIRHYNLPVCSLYNEGFTRLGCIGCPLASKEKQLRELERWPRFAANWKAAIIKNWERFRNEKTRTGKPLFQANFKSGEALWDWWLNNNSANDVFLDGCQTGLLWTNDPDDEP